MGRAWRAFGAWRRRRADRLMDVRLAVLWELTFDRRSTGWRVDELAAKLRVPRRRVVWALEGLEADGIVKRSWSSTGGVLWRPR